VTIGNNVTNIDNAAFVDCSNLVSITVSSNNLSYSSVAGILFNKNQSLLLSYPGGLSGSYSISSNVATIGDYAFQYCFSLTNVTIPNSVTNVGIYAFANGGLFQANFQGNAPTVDGTIGSFDSSVFGGESGAVYYVPGTTGWGVTFGGWPTIPTEFSFTTNNGTITITGYTDTNSTAIIPDTINGLPVTTIGDSAFSSSTLTNVTIGNNVTNFVDNTAFVNCPNLLSIAVSSGNVSFCSVAGILFNINQTVIISYPCGLSGNYSIPNGVTSIEDYAFYNCIKLTNLTMPDSVISIGIAAFASCSGLANVTISTNVSSIGHDAFSSCSSLTSVTIPNSITTISDDAFAWCSDLTNVMIPNSVTTISDDAFIYCMNLTSVTIPNSVTSIGFVAFYWSGLTSVAIPDSVTNVGFGAFAWCFSLTNAIVGNNVPSMDGLFTRDSSLMNVTVGNSVTYIGHGAFSLAILTGLTLPSTVTNIDSMAFSGCSLQQLFFEGNAPTADGVPDGSAEGSYSIFTDDGIGTVYYLPGTSGWGSTFGGWPTALWLPQTQLASNSSAFTNGFGFNINWASGQTVVVEASTNLLNWTPVSTNTLVNGTSAFVDPSWTNSPQQFYRVRPQ